MKRKSIILLILFLGFICGCATTPATPPKTQLQIREFQTRTYDTNDVKLVMKAMLNALQDEFFIVKNADVDLGLLTATKEVDIEGKEKGADAFFTALGAFGAGLSGNASTATWKKCQTIECSANISEFGEQTKVRINFQSKILDNKGGIVEVQQIDDPTYYQNFFSKVDKSIFIQKEKL